MKCRAFVRACARAVRLYRTSASWNSKERKRHWIPLPPKPTRPKAEIFMNYLHDNPHQDSKVVDENEDSHLGRHLLKILKRHENDINQIELVSGATETHGSVRLRSIRMAEALKKDGIGLGDVIVLCAENHNDICIPYIASLFIGAIPLGLTTNMKHIEIKHILSMGKPKLIFSDPKAVIAMQKVINELELKCEIIIFGALDGYRSFSDLVKPTVDEQNFACEDFDPKKTIGLLVCSSGSTGLPKLIAHSHYSIFFMLYLTRKRMTETERRESTFLTFSPLFWISGTVNLMSSCLLAFTRVQSVRAFSPEDFHKATQLYKPTLTLVSQLSLLAIVKYAEEHDLKITIRMIYIGGSPTSPELIDKFMNLAPDCIIVGIYGCTEMFFISSGKKYKRGACGRPLAFLEWKVVDCETEETLGPLQQGELRVKTPALFMGYYGNPESTNDTFDKNGWYKTGDLMYHDGEHIFMVDRIKQMIKYRNYQVSSVAIENLINDMPGVVISAVVGLPNYEDGEHPMAFVQLMADAKVSSEEILDLVKDNLSDQNQLRGGVVFIDSIPITYSGKVHRKRVAELKKNYINGLKEIA